MTQYYCPICNKRACDSAKSISLTKLCLGNEDQADIIIKCQCCKNTLAVNVTRDKFIIERTAHR